MKAKVRTYETDEIAVEYDAGRCIHVGECVRGLPRVFDPTRRHWIEPSLGPAGAVADVIRRCPTGALRYRPRDGQTEQPADENRVEVVPDGPLFVSGRLRIQTAEGKRSEETRVALCRCGTSRNKPYCDAAHVHTGFVDSASDISQRLGGDMGPIEASSVTVAFEPNGPIVIDGPVTVCGADGGTATGKRGALCRCGESGAKPYCDGSHVASGFQAD